jgi:hypothetical protein
MRFPGGSEVLKPFTMRERDLRGMTEDRWTRRTARPEQKLARLQRLLHVLAGGSSARDQRGRPVKDRRSIAPQPTTKDADLQDVFTGATGLEPATSGVTGRSWRFRPERG